MAKAKTIGLDDYIATLDRMSSGWDRAAGRAVYDGAGLLARYVEDEINALPIRSGQGSPENRVKGVTSIEKTALLTGFGIARMRNDNGFRNVRLGFDGYDGVKTRLYPNGHAISMIARSVNHGTSWMVKIPFITRAYNKARKEVERTMQRTFEKELNING